MGHGLVALFACYTLLWFPASFQASLGVCLLGQTYILARSLETARAAISTKTGVSSTIYRCSVGFIVT